MTDPGSVRELLERFRDAVNRSDSDLTATFEFVADGEGTYRLVLSDGRCELVDGAGPAGEATSTIFATAEDALLILSGRTDSMKAFMEGRMRIEGDLIAMSKLQVFSPEGAESLGTGASLGHLSPQDSPALRRWTERLAERASPGQTLRDVAAARGMYVGAAVPNLRGASAESHVHREFNGLGAENAFKWSHLAKFVGQYDFGVADTFADYAERHGMRLRGHTLVWGRGGRPHDLESTLRSSADPAAELRRLMAEHIETVVGRYRGRVDVWDVVNEPMAYSGIGLDKNVFFDTLGERYVDESFALARAADPDSQLVLNEQISGSEYGGPSATEFLDFVRRLLDRGVPVDGVGLQGHMLTDTPDPGDLLAFLEAVQELGVFIEFTEVDMRVGLFADHADPLGAQADAYHRFAEVIAAVPAVCGVMFWGSADNETWLDHFPPFDAGAPNQPVLFDRDLNPKPAYFAFSHGLAARPPR